METDDIIVGCFSKPLRPYIVAIACFAIHSTLGIVYSFGNVLPYLVSYLRWKTNPDQTSGSLIWIQSMQIGLPFAMLIGGCLTRKFSARFSATLGFIIYVGSIALSYFAIQHSAFLFILVFGLTASFGNGVIYNSVLTQCQSWFPTRVGLISGIITAGFGCSAFYVSPLQTFLVNPDNYQPNAQGFFEQTDLLQRVPSMFLTIACVFGVIQSVGLLFVAAPKIEKNRESSMATTSEPLLDTSEPYRNGNTERGSKRAVQNAEEMSPNELLRTSTFVCLCLTLICNGVWIQTTSGLYKAYGQKFIHDDFFLTTVNSLASVVNCLSRVVWGYVVDKISYRRAMALASFIGTLFMWTLWLVREIGSPVLYLAWICVMFCCIGANFALLPYGTHKAFGQRNFGIMYGYVQVTMGIAGVISALSSQFLLEIIGFEWLYFAIGCVMFTSFTISLLIHKTRFGSALANSHRPQQ